MFENAKYPNWLDLRKVCTSICKHVQIFKLKVEEVEDNPVSYHYIFWLVQMYSTLFSYFCCYMLLLLLLLSRSTVCYRKGPATKAKCRPSFWLEEGHKVTPKHVKRNKVALSCALGRVCCSAWNLIPSKRREAGSSRFWKFLSSF